MSIEKAEKYLKAKEEKVKLSRKRGKEFKDYNRILIAAIGGKRDAANTIFRGLADNIEAGKATNDQLQIIAKVLREIADKDQAVNFLAAKTQKTKPTRSFFKMQKIFEAVKSLHEEDGVPLIDNKNGSGAFEQVAEKLNVSPATANRNYYDYKKFLDRVAIIHLKIANTPENRKKLISACKQEFEELMAVLTEEMTDEQKQEVRTEIWPSWVDNFLNHYFDDKH